MKKHLFIDNGIVMSLNIYSVFFHQMHFVIMPRQIKQAAKYHVADNIQRILLHDLLQRRN